MVKEKQHYGILDPAFEYTPSGATDIRKTFEKERKRLEEEAKRKKETAQKEELMKVRSIKR